MLHVDEATVVDHQEKHAGVEDNPEVFPQD